MLKDYSNSCCCVVDNGLWVSLAELLSNHFKKVYYHTTWASMSPTSNSRLPGYGIPGVERCNDIWKIKDSVDLFVFPDLYYSGLQYELRSQGKRVWGSGFGEELELCRKEAKEYLKKLGIPIGKYEVVVGIDKLREYLKAKNDVWVKVSLTRGDMESFRSINYKNIEPRLDELEYSLGAKKKIMEFIVEDSIPDAVEVGWDGYSVDGQFPTKALTGIEVKDKCVDEQTEVLTDNGWKFFRDLDKTEKFLTLNISDKRHYCLEYQSATDYICEKYNGKMLEIKTQNLDLLVSPNHRLLVTDQKHAGRRRILQKAKDIDLNKVFGMPNPKSLYMKGGTKKLSSYIRIGEEVIKNTDFAALMGMYLSEGCVRRRSNGRYNGGGYEVYISQEKYFKEFWKILNKLPYKFVKSGNGFRTCHKGLGKYLFQFGKSRDKFIPPELKNCSVGILKVFLHYYGLGDGHLAKERQTPTWYYYTISKQLADDTQELLIKVGIPSSIRTVKEKNSYVVAEHGQQRTNRVYPKHTAWKQYNGNIYCVSVPNQIICIRRNGKICWTGNSYAGVFKDYKDLPKQILDVNNKLSDTLKKYKYRNSFCVELRITKDGTGWAIDPLCRFGSPPGELIQLMYTNLPDILWFGAEGKCIDPIPSGKFGAELIIYSDWAEKNWQPVRFPKEIKDNVKLKNLCIIDGEHYVIPLARCPIIGAVVAVGNTMEESIKKVQGYADKIEGYGIEVYPDSLNDAGKEFDKLKKFGVNLI